MALTISGIASAASLAQQLLGNAANVLANKPVTVGVGVVNGKVDVAVSSPLADVVVSATKDTAAVIVKDILGSPELGGVVVGVVPGQVGVDASWLTGQAQVSVVGKDVQVSVADTLVNSLVQSLATPAAPILSAASSVISGLLSGFSSFLPSLAAPSR